MRRTYVFLLASLALPVSAGATSITVDGEFDDWANVTLFSDPDDGQRNDLMGFAITSDLGADGTPDAGDTLYIRLEMWSVQGGGNPPEQTITLDYGGGVTETLSVRTNRVTLEGCNGCVTYETVEGPDGEQYWEIAISFANLDAAFADGGYVLDVDVSSRGAADLIPASGAIYYDANTDVATPVQLLSQSAEAVAGGVVVSWRTGAEVRNAGFRVWKRTPAGLVAVSPPIPAAGTPGTGADYEIFDATGRAGHVYLLEDVDEDGASTFHPPFGARRGVPAPLRVVPPAMPAPPARPGPRLEIADVARLGVDAEGVYAIEPAELIAAGIDPEVALSRDLSLTHEGRPVRLLAAPAAGGRLLFHAPAPRNAYDGVDAYRLEGRGPGPLGPVRRLGRAGPRPEASFRSTVLAGGDEVYDWYVEGDDAYAWRLVRPSARGVVGLELPDPVNGADALVTVRLHGGRSFPHRYDVVLNGAVLGTATWEGKTPHTVALAAPAALLDPAGDNVLEIRAAPETSASDYVYLHDVEVEYERAFVARDDELAFSAPAGRTVSVGGFTRPDVLLVDVTDPEAPRLLDARARPDGKGGYTLAFRDAGRGLVRYHAVAAAALRRPTVRPARERLLRAGLGADLLIVTTAELAPELDPLVELRRRQGLAVEVATVEEVYDAHAWGHAGPAAIRALVRSTASTWAPAPRFLLLAGQGSMDPRGLLGGADREQVPTRFTVTREFTLREPGDAWFGLDGRKMRLAVGRIPASTRDELRAAVDKIVAREELPGAARALVVADGPRDGVAFAHTARRLERALAGHDVTTLDVATSPDAAAELDAALDDVDLLAFVGHGWIGGWGWSGDLLSDEAKQRLRPRAPIAITSTCWESNFSDSRGIALAARLLLAPGAGTSGSFGPASMLNLADHGVLVTDVIAAAAGGAPTIGEAVRAGQQTYLDRGADRLDSLYGFVLLGDPAARSPLLP